MSESFAGQSKLASLHTLCRVSSSGSRQVCDRFDQESNASVSVIPKAGYKACATSTVMLEHSLWEYPLGAPSRHAKSLTTWEQHAGKAICRPSQWNAASGHTHQCAEYMREAVLDTLGRSGYEVTSMNATENKNITQLSPAFLPDFQSCEI